jgi:tripartite ATP-independent transporter DctP family solute receptor
MKRLCFAALMLLIAFTVAQPASAGDSYTFKITHEEYADTVPDLYAKEFARRVTEKSNGRIKFEIFQVGQLGVGVDLVEHLLTGSTQMAIVSPGNVATIVPEGQMFSLHFLLPSSVKKTYEFLSQSQVVKKDLAAVYAEKSLRLMDLWPLGASDWLSDRKITTPADFKGLPFRTMDTPLIIKNYEAYDANPTPVAYTDVYSSLQLNMVDGVENPLGALVDMKWYEVQKYTIMSNHIMYLEGVFMNDRFFKSLPEDLQNILTETIAEMHDYAYELQKKANADAAKVLAENTEVVNLTDDQIDAFRTAALPVRKYYKETLSERSAELLGKLEKELEAFK